MKIKDSGSRTEFFTGAVRDMQAGKGRMDLLPWSAIMEVARHCEEGALKYGERNVEKGIPIHSLIDSALRHLAKYMMGRTDEPHLRAAAWNVLYALWMELERPEMQDIPSRIKDDPCRMCAHDGKTSADFPCNECTRNGGPEDMFIARWAKGREACAEPCRVERKARRILLSEEMKNEDH